MDTFLQSQIDLIAALQTVGGLTPAMQAFSFLGSEQFFLLLLPFIYLCVDPGFGARLTIALMLSGVANGTLKLAFHLPRPYWVDPRVQVLATEASYGLPSNHAQGAVVAWTLMAMRLKKPWAWIAAIVLVLGISFSRLYLGVHFVSDVAGGWFLGGVVLLIYVWAEPRVCAWLAGLSFWGQVGMALGVSLGLVALGLGVGAVFSSVPDPAAWASFAAEARLLDGIVASAGTLFGIGVGLAMAQRWARFDSGGPLWKRAARFAIGIAGVALLYFGLRAVFPRDPEALGMVLRFIRYGVTAWWAIFLAPFILIKLKLA
jgi:membrane-associated phospholipid phosphatase